MNEMLLHYIWKFRLFNVYNLFTIQGEPVQLINIGTHNTHSGADFQNAKIKIGDTLWAGNIEMHIQSNDWFVHNHHTDAAYNSVILHVVFEQNGHIAVMQSGQQIPTLVLKDRINQNTITRFNELEKRKTWIPCQKFFTSNKTFEFENFTRRLSIERLENKVEDIELLLLQSDNDWENVLFQMIAKYLGSSINKEPFLQLAQSLPIYVWAKYQNSLLQLEALVFGQAGFLNDELDDAYGKELRKEYNYLKRLHSLQPAAKHNWKFLRLRPSNFPTLRLAQLAAIMAKHSKFFSTLISTPNVKFIHYFFDVEVSSYWQHHYQFDKLVDKANSHLGSSMKNILLINAVAPVLFAYGKYKDAELYCEQAIELLEACEPEQNAITKGWQKLGINPVNSFETQALLQLKNQYCDKFRCLECVIGLGILK